MNVIAGFAQHRLSSLSGTHRKGKIWQLLDAQNNTGAILTESYAMYPASSVSGFYFNYPESKYFAVGKLTPGSSY